MELIDRDVLYVETVLSRDGKTSQGVPRPRHRLVTDPSGLLCMWVLHFLETRWWERGRGCCHWLSTTWLSLGMLYPFKFTIKCLILSYYIRCHGGHRFCSVLVVSVFHLLVRVKGYLAYLSLACHACTCNVFLQQILALPPTLCNIWELSICSSVLLSECNANWIWMWKDSSPCLWMC
jgi:hypothetical protein